MPVIWVTTSLRLSRCWTLTVEMTVMPGVEQLLDVLPPFRVRAARGVGVGQFVDQHHLGLACEHRVDVEFGEPRCRGTRRSAAAMISMPSSSSAVLRRPCGLDHRGHQVGAAFQPAVRLAEHREGLADAGSGAQIDAQLTASWSGRSPAHHPPTAGRVRG